jgi:hypothetical protein
VSRGRVVLVLCALAVAGAAGPWATACPDPCVLAGGCNDNDDCADGQVCRIPRGHEFGCFVVKGTCLSDDGRRQATLCGSVDDCAADECCDPRWNRCVRADLYTGPTCDDGLTCRDCADADLREECDGRSDCGPGEVCDGALDSDPGLCARVCDDSRPCPRGQRCVLDRCTVGLGKPCISDEERDALVGVGGVPQHDRCHGLSCVAVDANGDGVNVDPYCTGNCILQEDRDCAEGLVCAGDECRVP